MQQFLLTVLSWGQACQAKGSLSHWVIAWVVECQMHSLQLQASTNADAAPYNSVCMLLFYIAIMESLYVFHFYTSQTPVVQTPVVQTPVVQTPVPLGNASRSVAP